jgi:sigma-B regulation protein RsbU (phosphoserine phosphatase)
VRFEGDGRVEYALAGHPPILHCLAATGETSRLSMEQFPVGMFPSAEFATQTEACSPGDLFAIVTDGILEVSNVAGIEFGLERLATILKDNADKPLQAIFDLVLAQADAFGNQDDDQTLLLVRVRA